jgi:hypothetical protein
MNATSNDFQHTGPGYLVTTPAPNAQFRRMRRVRRVRCASSFGGPAVRGISRDAPDGPRNATATSIDRSKLRRLASCQPRVGVEPGDPVDVVQPTRSPGKPSSRHKMLFSLSLNQAALPMSPMEATSSIHSTPGMSS